MGTINHIKTSAIADGTNTNLIRPGDWNSVHAYTLQDAVSLSGNTSGVMANISSGTFYLAGGNNITLSQNANSVTVSGPNVATASVWPPTQAFQWVGSQYDTGSTSQGAAGNSTQTGYTFSIYFVPFVLPVAIAYSNLYQGVSHNTSAGTGSGTRVISVGLYTNNASTLSLVNGYYGGVFLSQNSSSAWTYSVWTASTGSNLVGGAGGFAGINAASIQSSQGNINSLFQLHSGAKWMRVDKGVATTLTDGQYYFALANCMVSSGAFVLRDLGIMQSQITATQNTDTNGIWQELGVVTSASLANMPGWGRISTTFTSQSNAATWFPLPTAVALSNLTTTQAVGNAALLKHFPFLRN